METLRTLNTNLIAKPLSQKKFPVPGMPGAYIIPHKGDWGIWDNDRNGWVRLNPNEPGPYIPLGGEFACKEIEASGLYDGYDVVQSE
jgi:hypothetical protein